MTTKFFELYRFLFHSLFQLLLLFLNYFLSAGQLRISCEILILKILDHTSNKNVLFLHLLQVTFHHDIRPRVQDQVIN